PLLSANVQASSNSGGKIERTRNLSTSPMLEVLEEAHRDEAQYRWSEATKKYVELLARVPKNELSRIGDISERMGYSYYRASFQSGNTVDFRELVQKAISAYSQAGIAREQTGLHEF